MTKAISMAALGLILSFIGTDMVSGQIRYTYDIDGLLDGIGIVPVVMGFFAIAEIFDNLEMTGIRSLYRTHIKGLFPTLKDWLASIWAIVRGTVIGFFLGILPGGGVVLASFVAYAVEKKVSKHPERFGTGVIEGVASPESANNAASSGAFIPLLTLGIPSTVVMAVLFAGFLIHSITPGPLLLKDHPDIFWGIITSMYIGNVMLLVLILPLIGMWVQITKVPFRLMFPLIILICIVGVYSVNNSVFDIWIMIIFGVLGYVLKKCKFEPAPLVLAYVLGPLLEQAMRQSLIISNGSFKIFLLRPISAVCLAVAAFLLITAITGFGKKKRFEVVNESEL